MDHDQRFIAEIARDLAVAAVHAKLDPQPHRDHLKAMVNSYKTILGEVKTAIEDTFK